MDTVSPKYKNKLNKIYLIYKTYYIVDKIGTKAQKRRMKDIHVLVGLLDSNYWFSGEFDI